MANYRISNQAQEDLIRIHQYGVKRFGMNQADKYFNSFFDCFELIADRPFTFKSVDYIKPRYRSCVCGVDTIYYRINNNVIEIHGFVELSGINIDDYGPLQPTGMTALFDASYDAIGATLEYSKRLIDQDFDCNGAVYIITDGDDNASSMTPSSIKELTRKAMNQEEIESMITILVGVLCFNPILGSIWVY